MKNTKNSKRLLSALLCLVVLLFNCGFTASAAGTFSDVPNSAWYASAVDYVMQHKILSGTSETTFSPNAEMTRGMFVTGLGRASGVDPASVPGSEKFKDVSNTSWYGPYVVWAYENGFIQGTSDTTFSPDQMITRQQIAVIIHAYFNQLGINLADSKDAPISFNDNEKVSAWAKDGVEAMRRSGFMAGNGAGNFEPTQPLTRAEAATILMRLNRLLETGDINGVSASAVIQPAGMTVSKKNISLSVGETYILKPYFAPASATNRTLSYRSSNSSVATVDSAGAVAAVKAGTSTLTATTSNGKTVSYMITVVDQQVSPVAPSFAIRLSEFQKPNSLAFVTSDTNGALEGGYVGYPGYSGNIGGPDAVLEELSIYPNNFSSGDSWMLLDDGQLHPMWVPTYFTFTSSDESVIKVNERGDVTDAVLLRNGDAVKHATITVTCKADRSFIEIPVTISPQGASTVDDTYAAVIQAEIFRLVNEERVAAGVAPLKYIENAQPAADLRAEEFSITQNHKRPDGSDFSTVQQDFELGGSFGGENGNSYSFNAMESAEDVATEMVQGWMSSSGHRANILNKAYKTIAIGLYITPDRNRNGVEGYQYTAYTIQLFSRAPASYFD